MSGKINVAGIAIAHFKTLRDYGKDRVSLIDLTVFFVCPAFIALVIFTAGSPLTSVLLSALINAAAILLGLLLNLLVLMFDQRNKAGECIGRLDENKPDYNGKKINMRLEVL